MIFSSLLSRRVLLSQMILSCVSGFRHLLYIKFYSYLFPFVWIIFTLTDLILLFIIIQIITNVHILSRNFRRYRQWPRFLNYNSVRYVDRVIFFLRHQFVKHQQNIEDHTLLDFFLTSLVYHQNIFREF